VVDCGDGGGMLCHNGTRPSLFFTTKKSPSRHTGKKKMAEVRESRFFSFSPFSLILFFSYFFLYSWVSVVSLFVGSNNWKEKKVQSARDTQKICVDPAHFSYPSPPSSWIENKKTLLEKIRIKNLPSHNNKCNEKNSRKKKNLILSLTNQFFPNLMSFSRVEFQRKAKEEVKQYPSNNKKRKAIHEMIPKLTCQQSKRRKHFLVVFLLSFDFEAYLIHLDADIILSASRQFIVSMRWDEGLCAKRVGDGRHVATTKAKNCTFFSL
jgi:hypothetical protein